MPRTDGLGWVMKQEAVRARGLVSMVFDDQRFVRERREYEGSKGRPGNVDHIGFHAVDLDMTRWWREP